ncbi:unnamed protein product, partial [Phaeothamnion confervicola]
LFSWHPICLSVATAALSTSGIATILSRKGTKIRKRVSVTQLHALQSVSSVFIAGFGLFAIYKNKELYGKPHLTSWHGRIGALAAVLWVASWALALIETLPIQRNGGKGGLSSKWHRTAGQLGYAAGAAALALGFQSGFGTAKLGASGANAAAVAVAVMAALTLMPQL